MYQSRCLRLRKENARSLQSLSLEGLEPWPRDHISCHHGAMVTRYLVRRLAVDLMRWERRLTARLEEKHVAHVFVAILTSAKNSIIFFPFYWVLIVLKRCLRCWMLEFLDCISKPSIWRPLCPFLGRQAFACKFRYLILSDIPRPQRSAYVESPSSFDEFRWDHSTLSSDCS